MAISVPVPCWSLKRSGKSDARAENVGHKQRLTLNVADGVTPGKMAARVGQPPFEVKSRCLSIQPVSALSPPSSLSPSSARCVLRERAGAPTSVRQLLSTSRFTACCVRGEAVRRLFFYWASLWWRCPLPATAQRFLSRPFLLTEAGRRRSPHHVVSRRHLLHRPRLLAFIGRCTPTWFGIAS